MAPLQVTDLTGPGLFRVEGVMNGGLKNARHDIALLDLSYPSPSAALVTGPKTSGAHCPVLSTLLVPPLLSLHSSVFTVPLSLPTRRTLPGRRAARKNGVREDSSESPGMRSTRSRKPVQ